NPTEKTKLDTGVEVTGRVLAPDGTPLPKAKVTTVRDQHVSNDYGKTTTTNEKGEFKLSHIPAGVTPVTVTVKNYAPMIVESKIESGMQPLQIKLAAGKTVRGR